MLRLSTGDRVEVQAKRAVTADRSPTSPLGKTLRQFVDSYLDSGADATDGTGGRPARLVLATSGSASRSIREDLPQLIARAAGDPATALDAVLLTNQRQRTVWPTVLKHLRDAWRARRQLSPTDPDLRPLIELIRIQQLDSATRGKRRRA